MGFSDFSVPFVLAVLFLIKTHKIEYGKVWKVLVNMFLFAAPAYLINSVQEVLHKRDLFYPVLKQTLSDTMQLYFKKLKETKAAYKLGSGLHKLNLCLGTESSGTSGNDINVSE